MLNVLGLQQPLEGLAAVWSSWGLCYKARVGVESRATAVPLCLGQRTGKEGKGVSDRSFSMVREGWLREAGAGPGCCGPSAFWGGSGAFLPGAEPVAGAGPSQLRAAPTGRGSLGCPWAARGL